MSEIPAFQKLPYEVPVDHVSVVLTELCGVAKDNGNIIPAAFHKATIEWAGKIKKANVPVYLGHALLNDLAELTINMYLQPNKPPVCVSLFTLLGQAGVSTYGAFAATPYQPAAGTQKTVQDLLGFAPADFRTKLPQLREDMALSVQPDKVLGILKYINNQCEKQPNADIDPILLNTLLTMHPDNIVAFLTFPTPTPQQKADQEQNKIPSCTDPDSHLAMPVFPTTAQINNPSMQFADPDLTRQVHMALHAILAKKFKQKQLLFDIVATFVFHALITCGRAENLLCSLITNQLDDTSTLLLDHLWYCCDKQDNSFINTNQTAAEQTKVAILYNNLNISSLPNIANQLVAVTASPSTYVSSTFSSADPLLLTGPASERITTAPLTVNKVLQTQMNLSLHIQTTQQLSSGRQVDVRLETGTTEVQTVIKTTTQSGQMQELLLEATNHDQNIHRSTLPILDSILHLEQAGTATSLHPNDFQKIFIPHQANLYKVGLDVFRTTGATHDWPAIWFKYGYDEIDKGWWKVDREDDDVKIWKWPLEDYSKRIHDLLLDFADNGAFDETIFKELYTYPSQDLQLTKPDHVYVQLSQEERFNLLKKNAMQFSGPQSFQTFTPATLTKPQISELKRIILPQTSLGLADAVEYLDATNSAEQIHTNTLSDISYLLREKPTAETKAEVVTALKTNIVQLVTRVGVGYAESVAKIVLTAYYTGTYMKKITKFHFTPADLHKMANGWPDGVAFPEVLLAMLFKITTLGFSGVQKMGEAMVAKKANVKSTTWFNFMNLISNNLQTLLNNSQPDAIKSFTKWLVDQIQPLEEQLYMNVDRLGFFSTASHSYTDQSATLGSLASPILSYNTRILSILVRATTKAKDEDVNAQLRDVKTDFSPQVCFQKVLPLLKSQHELEVYHATQILSMITAQDNMVVPTQVGKNVATIVAAMAVLGNRAVQMQGDPIQAHINTLLYLTFAGWLLNNGSDVPLDVLLYLPTVMTRATTTLYSVQLYVQDTKPTTKELTHLTQLHHFPHEVLKYSVDLLKNFFPTTPPAAPNKFTTTPNLIKVQFFAQVGCYAERIRITTPPKAAGGVDLTQYDNFIKTDSQHNIIASTNLEQSIALTKDHQTAIINVICTNIHTLHQSNNEKYLPYLKLIAKYLSIPFQHIVANIQRVKQMSDPKEMKPIVINSLKEIATLSVTREVLLQLCLYRFVLQLITSDKALTFDQCFTTFFKVPFHHIPQNQQNLLSKVFDRLVDWDVGSHSKKLSLALGLINNAPYREFTSAQATKLVTLLKKTATSGAVWPNGFAQHETTLLVLSAFTMAPNVDVVRVKDVGDLFTIIFHPNNNATPLTIIKFLYTCFKWRPDLLLKWSWETTSPLDQVVAKVMTKPFQSLPLPPKATLSPPPQQFCILSTLLFLSEQVPAIKNAIISNKAVLFNNDNKDQLTTLLYLALSQQQEQQAPITDAQSATTQNLRPMSIKFSTIAHLLIQGFPKTAGKKPLFHNLSTRHPKMYTLLAEQLLSVALTSLALGNNTQQQDEPSLELLKHFDFATNNNTKGGPYIEFLRSISAQLVENKATDVLDVKVLVCKHLGVATASFLPHKDYTRMVGEILLESLGSVVLDPKDKAYGYGPIVYKNVNLPVTFLSQKLLSCLSSPTPTPLEEWLSPVLIQGLAVLFGFGNRCVDDKFVYSGPAELATIVTTLHYLLNLPANNTALGAEFQHPLYMLHAAADIAERGEVYKLTTIIDNNNTKPNKIILPQVATLRAKTNLNLATCQILIAKYYPPAAVLDFLVPGPKNAPQLDQLVESLALCCTTLRFRAKDGVPSDLAPFCKKAFITLFNEQGTAQAKASGEKFTPLTAVIVLRILSIIKQFDLIDIYAAFTVTHVLLSRGWPYYMLMKLAEWSPALLTQEDCLPSTALFSTVLTPLLRYPAPANRVVLSNFITTLMVTDFSSTTLADKYQNFFAEFFTTRAEEYKVDDFMAAFLADQNKNSALSVTPEDSVEKLSTNMSVDMMAKIVKLYKNKQGAWWSNPTNKDDLQQLTNVTTKCKAEPQQTKLKSLFIIVDWCNYFIEQFNSFFLHNGQLAAVFHITILTLSGLRPNGSILNIQTGEGKTVTFAAAAAILTLLGHTVDVVSSTAVLASRDVAECLSFFTALGLTAASNQDTQVYKDGPKECYNKQIVYGDLSDFKFDYLRDVAFKYNTRNNRKFDIILLDEADSILVDSVLDTTRISEHSPGMDELLPLYPTLLSYARGNSLTPITQFKNNASLKELVIYNHTWAHVSTACNDGDAKGINFVQDATFLEYHPTQSLHTHITKHATPKTLVTNTDTPNTWKTTFDVRYEYSCKKLKLPANALMPSDMVDPSRVFKQGDVYYEISDLFTTFFDDSLDLPEIMIFAYLEAAITAQAQSAPYSLNKNIVIPLDIDGVPIRATFVVQDAPYKENSVSNTAQLFGTTQVFTPDATPGRVWILTKILQDANTEEVFNLCARHFKQVASTQTPAPTNTTPLGFTLARTAQASYHAKLTTSSAVSHILGAGPTYPLATKLLTAFPTMSPHIRKLFEDNFPSYLLNAYQALNLQQHVDYVIKDDIINIISTDTGVTQASAVQWDFGLHQFLQVKHGLKITTETLSSVFTSTFGYLRKYTSLYGSSGTIGDDHVLDYYKALPEFKIKHHMTIPSFRRPRRVDYPVVVLPDYAQHYQQIISSALAEVHLRRSVLIIMDNMKDAVQLDNQIKAILTTCPHLHINSFLYTDSNDEDQRVTIEKKCPAATIIISTNLAGRGTSISTSAFKQFGGLHVILGGGLYSSSRVQRQAIGRAGRAGDFGSTQIIACCEGSTTQGPDLITQFNKARRSASDNEKNQLKEIQTLHAPMAKFQDEKVFDELLKETKKLNLTTLAGRNAFAESQFKYVLLFRQLHAHYFSKQQSTAAEQTLTWENLEKKMQTIVNSQDKIKNQYFKITQTVNSLSDSMQSLLDNTTSKVEAILADKTIVNTSLPATHYLRGVAHVWMSTKTTKCTRSGHSPSCPCGRRDHIHKAHAHLSTAARLLTEESAQIMALSGAYSMASAASQTPTATPGEQFANHKEAYEHFVKNICDLISHVEEVAQSSTLRVELDANSHYSLSKLLTSRDDLEPLLPLLDKGKVFLETANLSDWADDVLDAVDEGQLKTSSAKTLLQFAEYDVLTPPKENKVNINPGKDVSFDFITPAIAYPLLASHLSAFQTVINPSTISLTLSATPQHIELFLLPYLQQQQKTIEVHSMVTSVQDPDTKALAIKPTTDNKKLLQFVNNSTFGLYLEKTKRTAQNITTDIAAAKASANPTRELTLCLTFATIADFKKFTTTYTQLLPSTTQPQDQNTIFSVSGLTATRCNFTKFDTKTNTNFVEKLGPLNVTATFSKMNRTALKSAIEQLRTNKITFSLTNLLLTGDLAHKYFSDLYTTKFVSTTPTEDAVKPTTSQLSARGMPKFFKFAVPPDNTWDLIFLGAMSAAQLVAGALLIVFVPALASVGANLIAEGVSDLVVAVNAYLDPSSFSMSTYWVQKAVAVAGSVLGFGLGKAFTAINSMRKAGKVASVAQTAVKTTAKTTASSATRLTLKQAVKEVGGEIVDQVVTQGLELLFKKLFPELTKMLFQGLISPHSKELAEDTFKVALAKAAQQQLISTEEGVSSQSGGDKNDTVEAHLNDMCYIIAYESIVAPTPKLPLRSFDFVDVLSRALLGNVVEDYGVKQKWVDSILKLYELLKPKIQELITFLTRAGDDSSKKQQSLASFFSTILYNAVLIIPNVIVLIPLFNTWFWYAVRETKAEYMTNAKSLGVGAQKEIKQSHETMFASMSTTQSRKVVLQNFKTQYQDIHTAKCLELINQVLTQVANVGVEKAKKSIIERYSVKPPDRSNVYLDLNHYGESAKTTPTIAKLLKDYNQDHTHRINSAIVSTSSLYKPTQDAANLKALNPAATKMRTDIADGQPISSELTTNYLRDQKNINTLMVPPGVHMDTIKAHVKDIPALMVQPKVNKDGTNRNIIVAQKKNDTTREFNVYDVESVAATAKNYGPRIIVYIDDSYVFKTKTIDQSAPLSSDVMTKKVGEVRNHMATLMAKNPEATNAYAIASDALQEHHTTKDFYSLVPKNE